MNSLANKDENDKLFIYIIIILILSPLFLYISSGFISNQFCVDDNRNQWLPIIDTAFENFMKYDKIPQYNFYQMKGLEILDVGYYSLLNPLMFFSFLIDKYIINSDSLNTITIYIYILFSLGNVFIFLVSKNIGCTKTASLITVIIFSSSCCFVAFGYWYYVYNNYFFIPFFLWHIIKLRNSKLVYFILGILLSFSLLLGNVQYTVFHYLSFFIISIILFFKYNKKFLFVFISNVIVSFLLSFFHLILLLQASSRSSTFQNSGEFFSNRLHPLKFLIYSIIPHFLISNNMNNWINSFSIKKEQGWHPYQFAYSGVLVFGILILLLFFIKKSKENKKEMHKQDFLFYLGISTFIVSIFFMFFTFGKGGIIALVLSIFPIIKNFRYLLKGLFIMIPFLLIPTCLFIKNFKYKKISYFICCVCFILSSLQNYFIFNKGIYNSYNKYVNSGLKKVKENQIEAIKNNNIEKDNYRICFFYQNNHHSGNIWHDYVESSFDLNNTFTRNSGTLSGIFSLGGYDIACNMKGYEQSKGIMKDAFLEYIYGNGVETEVFLDRMKDNIQKDQFFKDIIKNSVKYFLFNKKDEVNIKKFIELFAKCSYLSVKRRIPFDNNHIMIEIDGIPTICRSQDNNVELNSEINMLSFFSDGKNSEYILSFTYNSNIKATFISEDRTQEKISVSSDADGYIKLTNVPLKVGQIKITYENILGNLAYIFTILIILLLIVEFIYTSNLKYDKIGNNIRIKPCNSL